MGNVILPALVVFHWADFEVRPALVHLCVLSDGIAQHHFSPPSLAADLWKDLASSSFEVVALEGFWKCTLRVKNRIGASWLKLAFFKHEKTC